MIGAKASSNRNLSFFRSAIQTITIQRLEQPLKNKFKSIKWNMIGRSALIVVISLIVGLGIYNWNARSLTGNALPMPFGIGVGVVLSGSMEPELSIDDVILVKERDTYEVGNIVVYQSGYTLIVHKIIRIEDEDHVVTKGIANEGEDDPIRMKDIKGEVFFDIPYLGLIVSILKTPVVTFLLLAVAVYLLVRSYQNERVRDNREMDAIRQEIQRLKGGGEQSIEDIKAEIQRLKEEQQSTEQK